MLPHVVLEASLDAWQLYCVDVAGCQCGGGDSGVGGHNNIVAGWSWVLSCGPVIYNEVHRVLNIPVHDSQPEVGVAGDVDAIAAQVWMFQVHPLPAVPASATRILAQKCV